MWKAKQKTAFHISHSHDGGYGIYPNAKTKTDVYTKYLTLPRDKAFAPASLS
jgi:hypothetical protein